MNNKKIYLLTGPVGSGKTTMLLNWSKDRDDIAGILTPKVMNNRMFMNASSRELFAMLAAEGEVNTMSVGRYLFSQSAFDKAIKIIQKAASTAIPTNLLLADVRKHGTSLCLPPHTSMEASFRTSANNRLVGTAVDAQKATEKKAWLIIDEIGPLELRNEGFADILKKILNLKNREQDILLVVRTELYDKVIKQFKIDDAIAMSNLNSLRSAERYKDGLQ